MASRANLIPVGPVWGRGLRPSIVARNGQVPSASAIAGISNFANIMAGRRGKVLFSKFTTTNSLISGSGTFICKDVFIPNGYARDIECVVEYAKTASGTVPASFQWNVGVVGGASIGQAFQYIAGDATGGASGTSDIGIARQRFVDGSGDPLTGGQSYYAELSCSSNLRILGVVIYEVVSDFLRAGLVPFTGGIGAVDTTGYRVGTPINTYDLSTPQTQLYNMWKTGGAHHIRWSNAATAPTRTGATYANILDGVTTGYSSSAAGFFTYPYRKNRLSATTVPVAFWARAKTNAGAGGRVRFVNSSGVLATLTGFNTTEANVFATGTLDATLADDLVIVEHSDSLGNTVTSYAAGIYEVV